MPGIVDGTRNLEALEDKPLIWVGGNAGPGKTTLIASALAKREVAGTWYLGARLAAAALPDLIRGMSAPEVLILDGRRTWAPTHPFTNFSWRACPKFQRARLKLLPTQADAGGIFSAQARQACNEVLVAGISVDSARGRIPRHARPTAENASDEWPWTFRVHVLGRFRLHKADAALGRTRSTQPKPIELLQVLIAFGGTEVCAGKLIDALWPDADGDAGYHALETTLYRLRRVLDASEAVQINHPIGQLINKALSIGRAPRGADAPRWWKGGAMLKTNDYIGGAAVRAETVRAGVTAVAAARAFRGAGLVEVHHCSFPYVTRASHGGHKSPAVEAPARAKSNDALSGLAPLLRVRPELRGIHRLGPRWLNTEETDVVGSAAFHIVTSGACAIDLIATRRTIILQAGDVAVLPRGAEHRIRDAHAEPSAPTRIVCGRLVFETSYNHLLLSALPEAIVMATSDGPEAARMCQLMQTIAYELDRPRQGTSAIANDLATALLVMVVRNHLERERAASGLLSLLTHRQAGRAVAAMLNNLSRAWSLDELAACAHASRASLVRMFRKQARLAPLEFLLGLRMEVARRKLATTRATLGEIAAEIGYHSESAFSRAFRRRFGIPPGEARGRERRAGMPAVPRELTAVPIAMCRAAELTKPLHRSDLVTTLNVELS